ncbi:hypothetical protein PORY_001852 [Pneumocystis oryctolagi]|uniref:Uncharacterized protein n=1 Tax=Pneumocystis oryctolagi TaxID=42067 RepID=A0ACB7CD53_9ASCO|nr:hypothetical protein PORY_001852 [Pneumocystis oryctolagi]
MSTFLPRYFYYSRFKTSWFPGHMYTGLKDIKDLLKDIDLVIETRDSRVPISSQNKLLEKAIEGKKRIIIFNKYDLSGFSYDKVFQDFYKDGILCSLKDPESMKRIYVDIKKRAEKLNIVSGMNMMVVGIPNVGKSTLLNSFRCIGMSSNSIEKKTRKAARTGSQPGITKKVTQRIKIMEDPLIYCMDTPGNIYYILEPKMAHFILGIMIPSIKDPITLLKLALIGSIKDNILDIMTLADYLLFRLNLFDPKLYLIPFKMNQPTNDVEELLNAIAIATGRLKKGGIPNIHSAATFLINKYRSGDMGKFILDDISGKKK